jgi:hypothetical protein
MAGNKANMTRRQQTIEVVTCDLCGRDASEDLSVVLGWDDDRWRIDLCQADYNRIAGQFDKWITNAELAPTRTSRARGRKAKASNGTDDWTYLESLGFTRHRGRKSAAEREALASRP